MNAPDNLADLLRRMDAANHNGDVVYAALKKAGHLTQHRVIVYRCANNRRCTLLDVVQIPGQLIVHVPRYKTSPRITAEKSSEAGRAANTEDGDHRWRARTRGALDPIGYTLACDHVHHVALDRADLIADAEAGHAEMRVRSDGTRYPG